jgi:mono/diheme cytochrome c family protein
MKLSYVFLGILLAAVLVVSFAGFRGSHSPRPPLELFPDMNYQDKVKDQQPSAFFGDGNSARLPIPGTIAEEMPAKNDYWATGKWDDTHWGTGIPAHDARNGGRALQVDAVNMARGRERYSISCAVCHGAAGDGQGITSKYGLNGIANYHVDRLRNETDGELFDTISNGKGQMLGYGYNVTIDDRWRIVMYVRALQRSQNAAYTNATPDEQAALEKSRKSPAPAPAPAKPAGSASNQHFQFNVGYKVDTDHSLDSVRSPLQFVPNSRPNLSLPITPLQINYGTPTAGKAKSPMVYLSQSTMKGWYDELLVP